MAQRVNRDTLPDLLAAAIESYAQYREQYDHEHAAARAAAIGEVLGGVDADLPGDVCPQCAGGRVRCDNRLCWLREHRCDACAGTGRIPDPRATEVR